jgi:diguanylate cyclase (GGDEF)-like protein
MAQKCKQAISDLNLPHDTSPIGETVSMSFGVTAQIPEDENSRTFIDTVDKLLYQAKANGRNRIECER